MSNNSTSPIDRTLAGDTTPGLSGSGSNYNEGVLHIPQSSKTGASTSNCLVSYGGHSLVGGAEIQSVHSTAILLFAFLYQI